MTMLDQGKTPLVIPEPALCGTVDIAPPLTTRDRYNVEKMLNTCFGSG